MKFLIGSEKVFTDFLNSIGKKDKIAVISHTDLDGVASVVFLEKILEAKGSKLSFIDFTGYRKGMFDQYYEKFEKAKITKVFLTDINADGCDLEGFDKFRKNFEVILIDHHPSNPELKDKKNIIKNHTPDCSAWVLYNFGKKYYDIEKWDWLVSATMVSEFSFRDEDNAYFLKQRYTNIEDKIIFDLSEPGILANKIGYNLKYHRDNLFVVYDLLLKQELKELEKFYEIVNKEVQKGIKKYKDEAELIKGKFYFAYFTPKYGISNIIVTALSSKEKDKIFVIASDADNGIVKISMRNQDGKSDANLLIKNAIKGLENASGGGHIYAASALIMKKDLEKFKENILN
jgi:single-stranded DNA-specific DHH superfamily exonuclease